MSKYSWNISDPLSCTLCVNCFVLTTFWHYLWSLTITDAQQRGVCLLKSGHMYLKGRHIHTLCLQIQLLRFCKLCVLHCHLFQERKQETELSNPLHLEIQDCKKSMNQQFFNNQEMSIQFLGQNQVIWKINSKSVISKMKSVVFKLGICFILFHKLQ